MEFILILQRHLLQTLKISSVSDSEEERMKETVMRGTAESKEDFGEKGDVRSFTEIKKLEYWVKWKSH
jgi:hypothetical protein